MEPGRVLASTTISGGDEKAETASSGKDLAQVQAVSTSAAAQLETKVANEVGVNLQRGVWL